MTYPQWRSMRHMRTILERYSAAAIALVMLLATSAGAQDAKQPAEPAPPPTQISETSLSCTSKPGETNHCAADTSAGVLLNRSTGAAPCLLGKTWGYDQKGVWVSDGCSAEFTVGQ